MQTLPERSEEDFTHSNDLTHINSSLVPSPEIEKPFSHTEAETQHDQIYTLTIEQHQNERQTSQSPQRNLRTQTSDIESGNKINKTLREQYLQSIRMSYQVLGSNLQKQSPQKKQKKLKKSFVIAEEDHPQSPTPKISKQQLKKPLKIDLKKLQSTQTTQQNYYHQLSEDLFLFNQQNKRWQRCHIDIDLNKKELVVEKYRIPLSTIEKIKIFKPNLRDKTRQVKLTYGTEKQSSVLFLNCNSDKPVKKLPNNYMLFQQLITQKLINQNSFKQTKWQKQPHICEQIVMSSYIFGEIYKKSQFLGKWEKRYIVLNHEGIKSYKSALKKEDSTFHINREDVDYLWTRFDMVDGFLVIKVKHGLKQTQFGIPVGDFAHAHFKNWLYYFYKLIEPEKNLN